MRVVRQKADKTDACRNVNSGGKATAHACIVGQKTDKTDACTVEMSKVVEKLLRMRVQSGRKQTKRMRVANVKSDGKHSLCYTLQFSRSKYGVEEEGAQLPLYLCIRGGGGENGTKRNQFRTKRKRKRQLSTQYI